jgi:hypothetical protein
MLSGILLLGGAAMTIFLAELKPVTADQKVPSQWDEFWSEFKLGMRVFVGIDEERIRVKPEFKVS